MDQQVYLINSPHRLKTVIYSVCVRCSILLFKFPISLIFPTFSFMKEMYLNIKLYAIIIDMSISFNERQFLLLIISIFFHVLNFILNVDIYNYYILQLIKFSKPGFSIHIEYAVCFSFFFIRLILTQTIPIPKKGNAKEWSHYHTVALISHASKVMLKFSKPGFSNT